jgi:hypothetical protein
MTTEETGFMFTPAKTPRTGLPGFVRIAAARSRFLVVFAAVFAVIGGWETIRAYWSRLTAGATPEATVSPDTEYFCPMDPGVLSDWPSKCPVCNMALVRRKRGTPSPLPDGVMARMQLTPYRLWLGGIKTATARYEPLARALELPGVVAECAGGRARVEADVFARELGWVVNGQAAEVSPIEGGSGIAVAGKVAERPGAVGAAAVARLVVDVERGAGPLRAGDKVRVGVACPVDLTEPFRSRPTAPPPLSPGEPRRLFVCMDHPEVVRDAAGLCPRDGRELMARPLRDDQRVGWWCPMHSAVTARKPGAKCDACGGMVLVPRVISYRPPGRVLAVPASAAIDDGTHAFVYVERGPGMFDARAVTLGPRCGAMVAVASGLEPGDRVVAQGAFLIDAETRLDPSLAAGYFGAGGRTSEAPPPVDTLGEAWLTGLDESDRPRALRQKTCPVTGKALGSMGVPPKLTVRGRGVFLCCDGCAGAVEADPGRYLAKLPAETSERRP